MSVFKGHQLEKLKQALGLDTISVSTDISSLVESGTILDDGGLVFGSPNGKLHQDTTNLSWNDATDTLVTANLNIKSASMTLDADVVNTATVSVGTLSSPRTYTLPDVSATFAMMLVGTGAPATSAPESTMYWDQTSNTLYVNDDGATSWTSVGGSGITGTGSAGRLAIWSGASALTNDVELTYNDVSNVLSTSNITIGDGLVSAPSIAFTASTGLGAYRAGAGLLGWTFASVSQIQFNLNAGQSSTGLRLSSDSFISWCDNPSIPSAGASDLFLGRDAANVLALRNTTTAQEFRLYNTYTDASNFERLRIYWSTNIAIIGPDALGTGTSRALSVGTLGSAPLSFLVAGNVVWQINTSNHLVTGTDNAYDIGASGTTRPRTGYFGTSVFANTSVGVGRTTTDSGVSLHLGTGASTQGYIRIESSGAIDRVANLYAPASGGFTVDTFGNSYPIEFNGSEVRLWPGATSGWTVNSSRHLISSVDNSYDIGASGATRPRTIYPGTSIVFPTTGLLSWSTDLHLRRATANVLQQSNATNAQAYYLYNTTDSDTSPVNYERGEIRWSTNVLQIGPVNAGTGTARTLQLMTGGTGRWAVGTTGHLTAVADNTYDIGASGATRPRTVYAGTSFVTAASGIGYTFTGATTTGIGLSGSDILFNIAGTTIAAITAGGFVIEQTSGSFGALLVADGANILAQKNSINAQALRIYGTTTGPRYLRLQHNGTDGEIGTNSGDLIIGPDGNTVIAFRTNGTNRFLGSVNGLYPNGGNTYDLGDITNTWRTLYTGTSININAQHVLSTTSIILNETGADLDIRIEGDNKISNFLLDASDDEVVIDGRFSLLPYSPSQITADQNDYNPESTATNRSTVWRLSSDATRSITGIANGLDGRVVKIWNVGSFSINLTNDDAASAVANRIYTGIGAAIIIAPNEGVELQYDGTTQRWRCHSKAYAAAPAVTGTGSTNQVAYWTSTTNIAGDSGFTYNATTDILTVGAAVRVGDGNATTPSFAFTNNVGSGVYNVSGNINFAVGGSFKGRFVSGGFAVGSSGHIAWGTGDTDSGGLDTYLYRDAANVIAQRNSTNAQELRVYNTYTDASNYERAVNVWSSNDYIIGTQNLGTGIARRMIIQTGSTNWWQFSTAGHFLTITDNISDIGASGATRPRTIYVGTSIVTPSATISGLTPTRVLFAGTGGIVSDDAGLIYTAASDSLAIAGFLNIGTATDAAAVGSFATGNTTQRLYYTTSGGAESQLYVYAGTSNAFVQLDSSNAANYARDIRFSTLGSLRWIFRAENTLESGSNVGSNLQILSRTDAGAVLRTDLQITRSTGTWTFGGSLIWGTDNTYDIGASGATRPRTLYVGTSVNVASTGSLAWSTDLFLVRDAANVLAQKNGTAAQTFRIYGTTTGPAYMRLQHDGTNAEIGTTAGNLILGPDGNTVITFRTNGTERFYGSVNGLYPNGGNTYDLGDSTNTWRTLYAGTSVTFTTTGRISWSTDLHLRRAAANVLQQSNTTSPQAYYLYNTTDSDTSPVNYERGEIRWNSNQLQIVTTEGGTGTSRSMVIGPIGSVGNLILQTANTARWYFGTTGHWLAFVDNTYDMGSAGASRARTIYAGTSFVGPLGSNSATVFNFGSVGTGLYCASSNADVSVAIGGTRHFAVQANNIQILSDTATIYMGAATDTILTRDAANVIAQRNGVNAQELRIYNTFTDASNYERLRILWSVNECYIQTIAAGTGVARALNIGTNGNAGLNFLTNNVSKWFINGTGNFLAATDNTYDLGAAGATRPRTGYFATSVGVGVATTPARKVEILDTTNPQLRLTHTAASVYTDMQVDVSGYYYLKSTGDIMFLGNSATNAVRIETGAIRMQDNSDSGRSLTITATKVQVGQINSQAYSVNNTGLFNVAGNADATELVRLRTNANTGYITMTQASVNTFTFSAYQNSVIQLHLNSDGMVGVGTTSASTIRLYSVRTSTNTTGTQSINATNNTTTTSDGSYTAYGMVGQVTSLISTSITNSSSVIGAYGGTFRSNASDLGTLSAQRGLWTEVGHTGTVGSTAVTTTATGLIVSQYAAAGTITTLQGIVVGAVASGGTVGTSVGLTLDIVPAATAANTYAILSTGGIVQFNAATSHYFVWNETGADADFRVEGDTDANLLFVDASADTIVIGTIGVVSGGSTRVTINNSVTNPSSTRIGMSIESRPTITSANSQYVAGAYFGGFDSTIINTGITHSGTFAGMRSEMVRYLGSSTDDGTLANQIGAHLRVGIFTGVGANARNNNTFGVKIDQFGNAGTQDAVYGVSVTSAGTGGVITNSYAFYASPVASSVSAAQTWAFRSDTGNVDFRPIATQFFIWNENGVDADFRVESDNRTHMIYVDASTDRLGIANTAPGALLHVGEGGAVQGYLRLEASGFASRESNIYTDTNGGLRVDTNSNSYAITLNGSIVALEPGTTTVLHATTTGVNINENGLSTVDFRVEGDNLTHLIFVDASVDYVGFNASVPAARVDIDGDLALRALSPSQITADQNNYAGANGSTFIRLSSDATRTITGFAAGVNGRNLKISNVGSFSIIIANQSASSTDINRVITGTGANITLAPDESISMIYDATTQRWRCGAKVYSTTATVDEAFIMAAGCI